MVDDLERQPQTSPPGRYDEPPQTGPPSSGQVAAEGGAGAARPGAKPPKPPRTRVSVAFQALIAGAIVLALLLIFILENTEDVHINYLGAKGSLSLGVALLLGAVGGALVTAMVGLARIVQLRRHAKRRRPRP